MEQFTSTVLLYLDDVALGGQLDATVTVEREQVETTDKASPGGWKTYLKHANIEKGWTVDFNGFNDPTGTHKPSVLIGMLSNAASPIIAKISDETSGNEYLYGEVILGSITYASPKNERAPLAFKATGSGPLNIGTTA